MSQNPVKIYGISQNPVKIYGISQNPDTKEYFMILDDKYIEEHCVKCDKSYTNIPNKWCKPCQIKENFTNWTSGNEKIDNLIQETQLKINEPSDIIFEWIPYKNFDDINEINKYDFYTIYSAMWKEPGLLFWNYQNENYERLTYRIKVILKCFHNSQNINDDFLNEV